MTVHDMKMKQYHPGNDGLGKNRLTTWPRSPLSLLARAADAYPKRTAVIHGDVKFGCADVYARARRLAAALQQQGVVEGDTGAAMLPNVPAMYEAHVGVPMTGAVLTTPSGQTAAQ